jgi:hypothetical protein
VAGVATDPDKVSAISAWPTPTNVKALQSFLGLAGYYRKFVRNFGIISQPLTNLLKKHCLFVWTRDLDIAFATLKQALVSALVLALPNFAKPFVLGTDASDGGIGAILMQDGDPLAYKPWVLNQEDCQHTKKSIWPSSLQCTTGGLIFSKGSSLFIVIIKACLSLMNKGSTLYGSARSLLNYLACNTKFSTRKGWKIKWQMHYQEGITHRLISVCCHLPNHNRYRWCRIAMPKIPLHKIFSQSYL